MSLFRPLSSSTRCFEHRRVVELEGQTYVLPDERDKADGGMGRGKLATGEARGTVGGTTDPRLVVTMGGKTRRTTSVPAWTRKGAQAVPRDEAEVRAAAKAKAAKLKPPGRAYVVKVGPAAYAFAVPSGWKTGVLEPGKLRLWCSSIASRVLRPLVKDQLEAVEFAEALELEARTPREKAEALAARGAIFVVNHSGGKDSQAMYLFLTRELKVPRSQIRVVHADLPDADWPGTLDHIKATTDEDVSVVVGRWKSGDVKRLVDYVEHRRRFPSPQQRWCTSDLKTAPIDVWMREMMCEVNRLPKGCDVSSSKHRVVVMCLGMRAQESDNRANLEPWELDLDQCKRGRIVFDYLPIFELSDRQVFATIKRHKQAPFWIYGETPEHKRMLKAAGSVDNRGNAVPMNRMSCVYCIMASDVDLGVASIIGPKKIAEQYCDVEARTGFTFKPGKSLRQAAQEGREKVRAGKRTRTRLPVVTAKKRRSGPCAE